MFDRKKSQDGNEPDPNLQDPSLDPTNVPDPDDPNADPAGPTDDPTADPSPTGDDPSGDPSDDPWATEFGDVVGEGKRYADPAALKRALAEKDAAATRAQQESGTLRTLLNHLATDPRQGTPAPARLSNEELRTMYEEDPMAANKAAGFAHTDDVAKVESGQQRLDKAVRALVMASALDAYEELKPVAAHYRTNATVDGNVDPPPGFNAVWDQMSAVFASQPGLRNADPVALIPLLYQTVKGNGATAPAKPPVPPVPRNRKAAANTAGAGGGGGGAPTDDDPDFSDPEKWPVEKMEAYFKKKGMWG